MLARAVERYCRALLSGNLFCEKTKLGAMIGMIHIAVEDISQLIFFIVEIEFGSIRG